MGYNNFRYARRVDANTLGIYHDDMTRLLTIDKTVADKTILTGRNATGSILELKGAYVDATPFIRLAGASAITLNSPLQFDFTISNLQARMKSTGGGSSLHFRESTTPTAIADFGAIYCKADNHLYFQDGAGAEHDIGGA
jgi:hypothetical protein